MPNLFNSIKLKKPNRNHFDLSHDVKLSFDMGELVPICCMECVPGDKFSISVESLLRFSPLVSPVMHRMDVYMHYFFVPNRILWNGWEDYIVGQGERVMPYFDDGVSKGTVADYLGVPVAPGSGKYSALPFAAYQKIYNDYYRDQNLITELDLTLLDGSNVTSFNSVFNVLRRRAWKHDYFTASLPFAQKGSAVDIPLGDVVLKDDWDTKGNPAFVNHNDVRGAGDVSQGPAGALSQIQLNGNPDYAYDPDGTLESSPTTINDLRRAFKLQEWLEKNARAGTRYVENILAHFGVKSSDARLQRPEYITGTKSPVVISEILNTTGQVTEGLTEGLPQGNMAGHGVSVTSGKAGNYFCEEHGYVIGIMSVLPLAAYQDGFPKHFLKTNDQFDFFWPAFAHIGEQPVLNREVYVGPSPQPYEGTFGYVPRYSEYKYMPSRVAGDFRDSLDFWHLGRKFASGPNLNQEFVECNPGKRIFAVESPDVDSLYCHVLNKIHAVRPMPKFGNPSF